MYFYSISHCSCLAFQELGHRYLSSSSFLNVLWKLICQERTDGYKQLKGLLDV